MSAVRWTAIALAAPGRELYRIAVQASRAWSAGRRPLLAMILGLLSLTGAALYGDHSLRRLAITVGGACASLPWATEVARLPGSVFLPTSDLPLMLAVMQIVVVIGLAELLFGWRAVLVVALVAQFVSTLSARLLLSGSCPGSSGLLCIPHGQIGLLDTGPSAITTAVGAWLLARCRARTSLLLLAATLLVADVAQRNLDGREHLLAFCCGLLPSLSRPLRWRFAAAVPARASRRALPTSPRE